MDGAIADQAPGRAHEGDSHPVTDPKPHPRWWRELIVLSRRTNVFRILEWLSLVALLAAMAANYVAYMNTPEDTGALPSLQVSMLLVAVLVPSMAILVLIGRRMALGRAAGSTARLHVRLVFFF